MLCLVQGVSIVYTGKVFFFLLYLAMNAIVISHGQIGDMEHTCRIPLNLKQKMIRRVFIDLIFCWLDKFALMDEGFTFEL